MTGDQWLSVESNFDALHGLPAAERAAGLASIKDVDVRNEVASLLGFAETGATITSVVGAMAAQADQDDLGGKRIGPYRLVRRLGQGGQGAVFEAVRDDGSFEQRVAIKIVKWELDSAVSRLRFRQERQILAGLEHPYIARLLDGGETPEGTPYIAMEYVDGSPLTAATVGWPLRRKLDIFLKIADAVAFAHRNLIVHRDLKPGNILVNRDGVPKLLDFGIARLIDANPQRTATQFQALTPAYASPEQVKGEAITTASDVYSLGVLLYELLAERRPYEIPTMSPVEIHNTVCLTDPPAPGVSRDLDNIVLMAMRKDPRRRYASVEQFAQDVQRSLEFRPVLARKDSFGYRAGRFVRRNALAIGAGAAVFVAITVGAAVALQQARVANARFQDVRRLAHSFVFDYDNDLSKVAGNTAVREKMVRTALEYLDNLSKSAGGDIGLRKELAAAYQKVGDAQGNPATASLGHMDQALASYRKAAELNESVAARDPGYREELGAFYGAYANMDRLNRKFEEAERLAQLALQSQQEAAREHPDDKKAHVSVARVWCLLGDINDDQGRPKAAYEMNRHCYEAGRAALARWHDTDAMFMTVGALSRLGSSAASLGRLREALAAFDDEEKILNELLAREPANPTFTRAATLLGQDRSSAWYDDSDPSMDDPARCLVYARENLEKSRRIAAADPNDWGGQFTLAVALFRASFPLRQTDPPAAVALAQESVEMFDRRMKTGDHSSLLVTRRARAMRRLAEALLAAGRFREADRAAEETLAAQRKITAQNNSPEDLTRLSQVLLTAAECADGVQDGASAARLLDEAERIATSNYAKNPGGVQAAIPLARVFRGWSAHWRKAGDRKQSAEWAEKERRLWQEFPDRNEFVQRQLAAN